MVRIFGTDGVRGIANSELSCDLAFKLGRAGAMVLAKNNSRPKILIGRDTRISGDMLESALVAGLCSMGADVVCAGVIPTPGVSYLVQKLQMDAGVVISASHNPVQYNGIKFFDASGMKLPDELEDEIQDTLDDLSSRRRLMTGFVTLIVLLTLCGVVLFAAPHVPQFPLQLPEIPLLFLAPVVGILWLLVLLFTLIKSACDRRDTKALDELRALLETRQQEDSHLAQDLREAQIRREHAQKYFEAVSQQSGSGPYLPPEAEACRASLHQAEQEIAQIQGQLTALGDPVLVDARLDEIQEASARLQGDYDAIEVAMEALKEADDQLHARFSPQLSQTAAGYFQQLTQGRFSQVALDRSFNVTVRETGALADRPLALLSQGTADQLYLALRLAVADLVLPSPQACPLILDDALLSFDDDRLAVVLHLLTELAEDRQILLFTCQHREFFMLEDRPEITTVTLPDF